MTSGPTPPNLGGPSGPSGPTTPSLGGPSTPTIPPDQRKEPKNEIVGKKKKSKAEEKKVYFSQFIRQWGIRRRRLRKTFIELMSREMHMKVHISTTNTLFKQQLRYLMESQIENFRDIIDEIDAGKDILSKKLRKKDKEARASTVVFHRLIDKIAKEINRMESDNFEIMKHIEDELKSNQDSRMEPRTAFWTLMLSGLILHNINEKVENEFEILMKVSLEYDNPYKHALVLFLHFVYYLIDTLPPFGKEDSQTNMVINAKNTGYSMAHWIKYRYGTNSQYYMKYENFISYYARSFGLIRGRAPDYKRAAYHNWLNRTFTSLEKTILDAELFQEMAKGKTIEGVIAGLIDQMEVILDKRIYNEEGKLLNQPLGGEGALRFLQWMLEAALNRHTTSNFTILPDARMDLGMFDFITPTIKWENELGERLVVDWLGLDEEDEEENEEFEEE